MARRILLTIEYDGTAYSGWQRQYNGLAVQQLIEEALTRATGEAITITGASRTDAGVHALGQCAHFDTSSRIPPEKYPFVLNTMLPRDIRVQAGREVPDGFHARFMTCGKRYTYRILNSRHGSAIRRNTFAHVPIPLDLDAMRQALPTLLGTHDFAAYQASGGTAKTTIRTIRMAEMTAQGDEIILLVMDNGMQHDIMRSIQKKPFLLMENCPSATNWQPVSKLKKPGMLHAASMQSVAHGSDSILYFQLRQSQGSSEKFHGAVIDHYGKDDTRVFKEVTEVGESLEKLQEVTGAKNPAQVAVVYDWENRWAMEDAQGPRNKGLFYKETVEKSYYAFRKQGLNVDMIDMEQDLDGYKVVAAPMLYMFREGFEEKVRKYVENGGTFILTYWSGIVDSTDLCFLEGTPHGLMDVMGLRSTEIDGLYDGEYNRGVPVRGNELCLTKTYTCNHLCELVKTSTAQPLMTYETDFYAGMPALTVNLFGKGKAYHVCADFEQGFYDEVYRKIAKEAGVKRVVAHIPEGVEVCVRRNQDTDYVFVQNFNRQPVEVKLPVEQYPVWLGKYDGTIDRFGTVVLKGKAGKKE